jgi:hypothetical protein
MRQLLFIFICISLLGCQQQEDWGEIYESMHEDLGEFSRTYSIESFKSALRKCDLLIQESSEYRNLALRYKAELYYADFEHDMAIKIMKLIPDTSRVFNYYYPKSMKISEILAEKAFYESDFETGLSIKRDIINQQKILVNSKRDSIYAAINKTIHFNWLNDPHLFGFITYIYTMNNFNVLSDEFILNDIVNEWWTKTPYPNKRTDIFFQKLESQVAK